MALYGAGQMSACKACAGLCGFVSVPEWPVWLALPVVLFEICAGQMSACACAGCWLMWPVSARVGLVLACVALMLVAWEALAGLCGWCCLLCSGVSMCGFCWLALACMACAGLMSACQAFACWLVWLRVGLCHHCLRLVWLVLACASGVCGLCWQVLTCVVCAGLCACVACAGLCGLCWQVCLCGLCWPVPPVSAACAGLCDWCWPDVSARGLPGLCAHAGDDPADDQAPTISQPLRAVSQ